jgi:putative flippase GtrA
MTTIELRTPASAPLRPNGHRIRSLRSSRFIRYLLVGGWNTAFGFACFAVMNRWVSTFITAYSYLVAYLLASLINITIGFLAYKWFVFRTKGDYFNEWLRTLTVYSGSIAISTLALAPLVTVIRHTTQYQTQAPYIAAALLAVLTICGSFLGHKHFSFRKTSRPPELE